MTSWWALRSLAHFEQPLLNFLPDDDDMQASRHNFDQLGKVVFASAAFPVAFAPIEIPHCLFSPLAPGETVDNRRLQCLEPERTDRFIDGGVFDNNPLRLSNRLSQLGLRRGPDGRAYWRDPTVKDDPHPVDPTVIMYVDPNRLAFPELEEEEIGRGLSFFDLVGDMAGDLVATARSKELYALVQESDDLSLRLNLSEANYPKASNELYAFIGFFERDFRYFDFFLGMYDGWVRLKRIAASGPAQIRDVVVRLEERLKDEWSPLACLIGWYEPGYAELQAACEGEEQANFRRLIQVSLDKVYDYCRKLGPDRARATTTHPRCLQAAAGEPPVVVAGVPVIEPQARRRFADEESLAHTMRLLTRYEFHFKDLGLGPDEAEYGRTRIRRRVLKVMNTRVLSLRLRLRPRCLRRPAAGWRPVLLAEFYSRSAISTVTSGDRGRS